MIFYKKRFLDFSKKLAIAFVSIFYFLTANNAGAVLGVGDVVFDPLNVAQSTITAGSVPTTAISTTATAGVVTTEFTWSALGKNLLDYIAYAAAQNLLNQLTNSTLKWIQGGFHGSPSFEVDTDQMATEIADNIAGNLALRLRGIASCNFTATYRDDLANSVYIAPKKKDYIFDNRATCPFKQSWNFTATEFYGGANKLTWDAFGAMLDDGGNPYGLQTITSKELFQKTADAKAKKVQETSWSNGFTDIKDMNDCNFPASLFTKKENILSDSLTDEQKQAEADATNEQTRKDPEFIKKNKQYCKTTTPGKIVGDQLTKISGIDMDRIGFADNMNKIIAAFLDQAMSKAVRGVFGTGNKAYSSGSIGDPLGGRAVGGPPPCNVQVYTRSASLTSDGARINGSVRCADTASNASVVVWFRWSEEPFVGDSISANKLPPSPDITHSGATGTEESFSAAISGLTPGTTYYYNAIAESSQTYNTDQLNGQVLRFTVPPLSPQ